MTKKIYPIIITIASLDLLFLNLCTSFFILFIKGYNLDFGAKYFYLFIIFNLTWLIINFINRYKLDILNKFLTDIKNIVKKTFFLAGIMSFFAFLVKDFRYSRLIIYGSILAFFILQIIFHYIFLQLIFLYWQKEKNKIRVVVAGAGDLGNYLFQEITKNKTFRYYKILGFLDDNKTQNKNNSTILGKLSDARKIFEKEKVDELFLALPLRTETKINKLLHLADFYGIRVRMIPDFFKLLGGNFKIYSLGKIPVVNINEVPLDNYFNSFLKRIFDICFSLFILVLSLPVFLIITIIIKIISKGPIFYRPLRVGYKNNVFKIFKFRTMCHNNEDDGKKSTIRNDPRIMPFGKLLRRYNLDEIPQFLNIFKGDMSTVGPRPHRVYLDKELQYSVNKYMNRHYIKPGLTGWAQVNGWRGPTQTQEQKEQRTKHDLWYLRNWTFWLDIKITFMTIFGRKSRINVF